VSFDARARTSVEIFARMGYRKLPVCMAKTHLSLSHDPELKGRPEGWVLPVRDVRLSAGAGFFYALCGDVMTMPGLPARPAGERVDIDAAGNVKGLF
jgi:formate--tetrahydrofolate ligase